jgi:hypothetical protein
MIFAGFFASCAAWTKNEGVPFAAALLILAFLFGVRSDGLKRTIERLRPLALGAAPLLALAFCFKVFIAPASDPFVQQNAAQMAQKLGDAQRYSQIAKALAAQAVDLGQWWSHPLLLIAILAVALRFRIDKQFAAELRIAASTLLALFASYIAAYLVTPSGLDWHLKTSLSRLYAQPWPAFLFLVFLVLRAPEETGVKAEAPAKKR